MREKEREREKEEKEEENTKHSSLVLLEMRSPFVVIAQIYKHILILYIHSYAYAHNIINITAI